MNILLIGIKTIRITEKTHIYINMSSRQNVCAFNTLSVLTGFDMDLLMLIVQENGPETVKRDLKNNDQIGDEIFQFFGIHMLCTFNIYMYLSDTKRVLVKSCGLQIDECKIHEIRFEPFGETYEETMNSQINPLFKGGHYEPVREVFNGEQIISPQWGAF